MSRSKFFTMPRLICLGWMLWISSALSSAAPAEEKGKDAGIIYPHSVENKSESATGHGSGYGSGVLVAALLLAGAAGWLFWRGRATPGGTVNLRKLVIAETKSLGNRQYLVVAAYEDKKFLLSVCPGRIELLTPLDATPPIKLP
jgi:flagellar protein FliO/FliZ